MKDIERLKPAFVRPKKWFSRDEWKKTKKFRVLSFRNSEGGICAVGVTEPWNSPEFVKLVRNDVGPWLRSSFPDHEDITILIDSEKVMHTPEAKAALKEFWHLKLEELAEVLTIPESTREPLGSCRGAASQVGACWRFSRSFQKAGATGL